jgi:hypothetical protein
MANPVAWEDAPEIPILLLGDAGVGKSTFLSYVSISFLLHFTLPFQPSLTPVQPLNPRILLGIWK